MSYDEQKPRKSKNPKKTKEKEQKKEKSKIQQKSKSNLKEKGKETKPSRPSERSDIEKPKEKSTKLIPSNSQKPLKTKGNKVKSKKETRVQKDTIKKEKISTKKSMKASPIDKTSKKEPESKSNKKRNTQSKIKKQEKSAKIETSKVKKTQERAQQTVPIKMNDKENEKSLISRNVKREQTASIHLEPSEKPEIQPNIDQETIEEKKITSTQKSIPVEKITDRPLLIGRVFRFLLRPLAPPLPVKKMLLPKENHLDGKLIIYFSEGQLLMGILIVLLSVPLFILTQSFLLIAIFMLVGSILTLTASGSEEIHVTNSRVLVRRINLLDRVFRVPRDSQYLIEEIVSFEIRRAPINRLLFVMGILPLFLFLTELFREWYFVLSILFISTFTILISLRLNKRSLNFNMSGGHTIHIGIQKGIPTSLMDSFTDIVLEKNLIDHAN